jgi:hypothetical protein
MVGGDAPDHSPAAVQLDQSPGCAVIRRETLVGGENGTARRAGETVWMAIGSRVAEITDHFWVGLVAEVKDESLAVIERVGEEVARSQVIFGVVRVAPRQRGQGVDDLTVARRCAIHVHNRQECPRVAIGVRGPYKEVSAAVGLLLPRTRRTAPRSQEEQASRTQEKGS